MLLRTFITIMLIFLSVLAPEAWQLFKGHDYNVNPWLFLNRPLHVQWYFKDLGNSISSLLVSIVIYRMSWKIDSIKKAAILLLIFRIIDLAMFFACDNLANYTLIYLSSFAIALIVYYPKQFWAALKEMPHWIISLPSLIAKLFSELSSKQS